MNFQETQSAPPEPPPRQPVPTLAEALSSPLPERREKFQPRYVELREYREQGRGPRNLALGVAAFLAAALLLAAAMVLGGPRALFALAMGLVTFTVLYVLARLHIFRQRHGVFLAVGVVSLLGAAFALCERGLVALDRFAHPAVIATQPVAPPAAAAAAPEPHLPLLTESFALTPPEAKAGPRVKALRDTRVVLEGKAFLIRTGDTFPLAEEKGGEVTFKVRDLRIALPASAVEVLGEKKPEPAKIAEAAPAPEPKPTPETTTAEVTKRAQEEAVKRYPALGIEGSRENILFITTFRELKDNAEEFFKNAEWPMELAELLAKREGWRRDDIPKQPGAEPAPMPRPNAAPTLPELPPEAR